MADGRTVAGERVEQSRAGRTVNFEVIRRLIQAERLVGLARNESNVAFVKEALARAGVSRGASVIDVGCGPLGALPTLAEVVGLEGTVVGVDRNEDVLAIGRRVLDDQGLAAVKLVNVDINEFDVIQAGFQGRFDAAYCRLFLSNQSDPCLTLRRVAKLVGPGGHIIAHELLDDPTYPRFDPPIPAFGRLFSMVLDTMRHQGRSPDVARRYRNLADDAGLQEISQRGLLDANPAHAPEFIQNQGLGMLMVFKEAFVRLGLASRTELDELARELKDATSREYQAFFSWIVVELIALVPPVTPAGA